MVSWCRFGFVLRILGHSFVLDISYVARVGIGHTVGDNLSPAIRKGNTVRPMGGIPVPVLVLAKVCSRIVVSYSILICIDSRCVCWGGIWGRRGSSVGASKGSQDKGSSESLDKSISPILMHL